MHMTEFKTGIFNLLRKLGTTSLGRATVYTIGHVIIAMTSNRLITGADWSLAGIDAIVEPIINGGWYYLLDKVWTQNGKVL